MSESEDEEEISKESDLTPTINFQPSEVIEAPKKTRTVETFQPKSTIKVDSNPHVLHFNFPF